MISKMPKIKTLRRHFPNCSLSDDELIKITEWLRDYLGQQHITPNNKLLKVLIDYEISKNKEMK